jgi:two-component system KDP operon response regulator KdpE
MKLLIVDDAAEIVEAVRLNFMLLWPDMEVSSANDAASALREIERAAVDVVLLDIGLPDGDGFDVLERVRRTSNVPVVMLTARDATEDKIRGLQLGADDYVTKPFNHRELIERVRAVLRRMEMTRSTGPVVRFDDLEMDFESQDVRVAGRAVPLTPTEYNLLHHLVRHQGVVQSHEVLLKEVWGPEYADEVEYLRVYVRRLREKLGDRSEHPRFVITERGYGYRFGPRRRDPTGQAASSTAG